MIMTKIQIKGPIVTDDMGPVYDFFKRPATYPKKVLDTLPDDGGDVEIDINSGGGIVDSGAEIYTALRNYSGHVKVNVVGLAASAASIIAMGADEVVMSPVAQMMIHNVSAEMYGDNRDHEHLAQVLEASNKSLASAYEAKTGKPEADVLAMMDKETWLTAQQAVDEGFADSVMFDGDALLTASTEDLMSPEQLEAGRTMMNQLNKPQPPVIHPTTSGITGHGLAAAYIKADDHQGKLLVDGHSDAKGNFVLKHKLNPGDEVRVTQADKWGTSKPAVAKVPGGEDDDDKENETVAALEAKIAELEQQINTNQTVQSNWDEPFFNA